MRDSIEGIRSEAKTDAGAEARNSYAETEAADRSVSVLRIRLDLHPCTQCNSDYSSVDSTREFNISLV